MARPKLAKSVVAPKEHRRQIGMNQAQYWSRLGTTQSGGSRYENEREVPMATAMLMALLELGKITDADLALAKATVKATRAHYTKQVG